MVRTPSGETLEPVFDWYQFSCAREDRQVLELLQPLEDLEPFRAETPKLKGYGWAVKLGGVGGSVLVHLGGSNGDAYGPNVAGTGPLAPKVAALIRGAGLAHGVSRADVRLDFLGDFEACRRRFIERCDQAGMAPTDAGSCPESAKQLGRTVYGSNSRSSFYRPTLYQKGLQLGDGHPADYLRLEHRFAPGKSAEKVKFSTMSPMQMIGTRPVSRDLTQSLVSMAVAPYKLDRYPKEKGPWFWMLKLYAATLEDKLAEHGSWAAVGCQIGEDLAEIRREEQRKHH